MVTMPAMAAGTDVARTEAATTASGASDGSIVTAMVTLIAMTYCWEDGIASTVTAMVTSTAMTYCWEDGTASTVTATVTSTAMTYCWEDGTASTVTATVTSIVGMCGLAVARGGTRARIA